MGYGALLELLEDLLDDDGVGLRVFDAKSSDGLDLGLGDAWWF
jgi:hypothetical protein